MARPGLRQTIKLNTRWDFAQLSNNFRGVGFTFCSLPWRQAAAGPAPSAQPGLHAGEAVALSMTDTSVDEAQHIGGGESSFCGLTRLRIKCAGMSGQGATPRKVASFFLRWDGARKCEGKCFRRLSPR
jgi:hypothetical protein